MSTVGVGVENALNRLPQMEATFAARDKRMTKNAQQLVGELVNSANNLITETTNKDGSTKYNINWQEFNKPQHKDLRKRFVNSGARDLFKYYDR